MSFEFDNFSNTEKFLSSTIYDCKEMLKYIDVKDKEDKSDLKKYKKLIKEMKKKLDESGVQGICEV